MQVFNSGRIVLYYKKLTFFLLRLIINRVLVINYMRILSAYIRSFGPILFSNHVSVIMTNRTSTRYSN